MSSSVGEGGGEGEGGVGSRGGRMPCLRRASSLGKVVYFTSLGVSSRDKCSQLGVLVGAHRDFLFFPWSVVDRCRKNADSADPDAAWSVSGTDAVLRGAVTQICQPTTHGPRGRVAVQCTSCLKSLYIPSSLPYHDSRIQT
jgi:hypothetical protein